MTFASKQNVFIFAGEKSGDLHGAHLIRALRQKLPTASLFGVGGPSIRAEGIDLVLRMEDFEVMGFSDILGCLPKLYRQFHILLSHILARQADVVVLIDYPGFNLRLAKGLRKKGFKGKIVQYVSPTVWAWKKNRIYTMANHLDLLMTIYPFEKVCYEKTSLPVKFVGNPLMEYIGQYAYQENWKEALAIPQDAKIIALFPGSRKSEIKHHLPLQLKAAKALLKSDPTRIFCLSCCSEAHSRLIFETIKESSLELGKELFLVPNKFTYELMRDCRTAIAKSGTVTLELALHQRPTIVIYHLTAVNHFIAKHLLRLRLPHYCIANILLEKQAFPEIVGKNLKIEDLIENFNHLDQEGSPRENCLTDCKKIASLLHTKNTSVQAALAISGLLT